MPILSMTPARITEPAVGASVCASGSQVCTGHIGTLIAKASAKAANSQRPWLTVSGTCVEQRQVEAQAMELLRARRAPGR